MSKVRYLKKRNLIVPPQHVLDGIQYETQMGSVAYGVSGSDSDIDIYGFSIPPKELVFPHLSGEILGFGKQIKRFEQYQQHHIKDSSNGKEYDISIYSVVKYFQLLMDNNPNIIDSLFTPTRCVLYCTQIGELVRENRKLFLHKGSWFKFKGYSFSQLHKLKTKNPEGKRKDIIDKYGYDTKFAYHIVRLLNEIEQILIEEDLDLERNNEQLKSIKRGEWSEQEIIEYFNKKEKELESLYTNSKLRHSPDEQKIKQLLLKCLEMYYGSLDKCIKIPGIKENLIKEMLEVIEKYR